MLTFQTLPLSLTLLTSLPPSSEGPILAPRVGEVLLELGPQFACHSRVHTPESHQDVAYCQAEATGAGSSDFAREKCGGRVEYVRVISPAISPPSTPTPPSSSYTLN